MEYEAYFLKSLLLTILIETSVLLLLVKVIYKSDQQSIGRIILIGILASSATLPYLWFILPGFIQAGFSYILVSELFAIFAESLIFLGLLKTKYYKALLFSLACNCISYSLGLLINWT